MSESNSTEAIEKIKKLTVDSGKYREMLLADKHRPCYHFAIPGGNGEPGDPNGAFFANGRYHLMYLYRSEETNGFHWGHISSADLLHWRSHPDALTVSEGDEGCFSGGAFLDDDGTAYLTFWKFPAKDSTKDKSGIAIAFSNPPYDKWERIEPIAVNASEWGILDIEKDGETIHIGCADPSNIWKADGKYYMELGNLCVIWKYGKDESSEEKYQGSWTELFCSDNLKEWEYLGRFYDKALPMCKEGDLPDSTEDDMCPSFLPLYDKMSGGNKTDKYLQLFISHNKGCQYLVGSLENEKFIPMHHGRMSWNDNVFFAPEALIDDKNRQIMWSWIHSERKDEFSRFGWTGVYSFPRVLWWEDEALHMAPAEELERLQYNEQLFNPPELTNGSVISVKNGESFRLLAEFDMSGAKKAGFTVRDDLIGEERTEIYFDNGANKLVFDAEHSGKEGHPIKEEAPFELKDGEILKMDIFVDRSIAEVYVNNRQAVCRRIYPESETALGVKLIGDGKLLSLKCFEIMPANMY